MELTHIALFAGIGGDSLAAKRAGFRQVLFVEIDEFCQNVLRQHWLNVPIIGDIRDATKERIRELTKTETVDLITGGFPCQPFSVAGKRRGKADDRYLWPEMFRVIKGIMPRWVVAENVYGILNLQQGDIFNQVLSDLEGEGYETLTVVLPACAINAPHRRDRVWVIANNIGNLRQSCRTQQEQWRMANENQQDARDITNSESEHDGRYLRGKERRQVPEFRNCVKQRTTPNSQSQQEHATRTRGLHTLSSSEDSHVANTNLEGLQGGITTSEIRCGGLPARCNSLPDWQENWYEVAARFCRVDDGIPDRVHRLKALGNAIVPQQIYPILKAIANMRGRAVLSAYCEFGEYLPNAKRSMESGKVEVI